jgi:hypothetical protein
MPLRKQLLVIFILIAVPQNAGALLLIELFLNKILGVQPVFQDADSRR